MKRRKDTICILLRASTFLLRRLLDLISEDSLSIRIPPCLRRRAFDTDGIREHLARKPTVIPRAFLPQLASSIFESTEYAAMDRMERIREGVRRRYIAVSSRARLIRERDDCNGEISSKLDSNSNDSSPYSSLPLISTPGGSRAGIRVFVGAGSRPVLLQTSRRRPLQLLPGFE